jgi:hypothetical protein
MFSTCIPEIKPLVAQHNLNFQEGIKRPLWTKGEVGTEPGTQVAHLLQSESLKQTTLFLTILQ